MNVRRLSRLPASILILTLLALSGTALAKPPAPPSPPAAPAAREPSLGGPKVAEEATKPTLIQRELDGSIKRLDTSPPEAAVRLLKLDDPTRAKVNAILTEQSAAWDALIRTNLKDVARIAQEFADLRSGQASSKEPAKAPSSAPAPDNDSMTTPLAPPDNQTTKPAAPRASRRATLGKAADLMRDLRELLAREPEAAPGTTERPRSLTACGPLATQLAAVLTPAQAADMNALVKEYADARAAELVTTSKSSPQPLTTAQANTRFMLESLGQDFRRAYDRVVGQASRDFDALIRELTLTPEQESKVRQIVGDSFQKSYGNASAAERSRIFTEVLQVLTPEQRTQLAKRLR
jgi:hypothetical protein